MCTCSNYCDIRRHAEWISRPPTSSLEDQDLDQDSGDEATGPSKQYAFPELDTRIRAVINEYGAVFPKLNFSSPKARPGQATIPLFIE
jgi:hypothetical protein